MCLGCKFEKKILCKLRFHIILHPKSETRLLTEPVVTCMRDAIEQFATEHDWQLEQLTVHGNMAHIVMQLPATISLDAAVMQLKSVTSKSIQACFGSFEEFANSQQFWAPGYIAQTVDGFTSEQEFMAALEEG